MRVRPVRVSSARAAADRPLDRGARKFRRRSAAIHLNEFAKETAIEKEEPIQLEGTVSEVLGNANFRVQVTEDHSVLAKIAGKMRRHRIRVLPGDRVKVEVTPYDLERGRIVYRYRN